MTSSGAGDAVGRVLIAERNPLVVAALRGLFAEHPRFAIADTARTSKELPAMVAPRKTASSIGSAPKKTSYWILYTD